jgi:regulator of sigma E protease
MLFTILVFIAVLALLVLVHESGHFLTARKLGVKSEEFGFGFPPRIFGIYKNKFGKWKFVKGTKSIEDLNKDEKTAPADTIYSFNWIFAGGFVKIKGENGDGAKDPDSFIVQKAWKKILILVAGVVMNIVLAWLLLSTAFMFGMNQDLEMAGRNAKVSNPEIIFIGTLEDSPAQKAGIEAGDALISLNGENIRLFSDFVAKIESYQGEEVSLEIQREDEQVVLTMVPEFSEELNQAAIGVAVYNSATVSYPFLESIWQGAKSTGLYLKLIVVAFYNLIADLIVGESVEGQVGGPIAIAQYTGEIARFGLISLLQFIAILSLNLAIINILPIPALDGGRILFILIEKIKGSPIKAEIEGAFHTIGFALLMLLILFVTYKDIANLFN